MSSRYIDSRCIGMLKRTNKVYPRISAVSIYRVDIGKFLPQYFVILTSAEQSRILAAHSESCSRRKAEIKSRHADCNGDGYYGKLHAKPSEWGRRQDVWLDFGAHFRRGRSNR